MNKTTFTKGPWKSGWVGERPHGAAVVWIPDSSTCNERVEVHTSNARANARLIASAPELFKALKAIYEIDVPDAEWSPTLEKCFGVALDAIANVEGEK